MDNIFYLKNTNLSKENTLSYNGEIYNFKNEDELTKILFNLGGKDLAKEFIMAYKNKEIIVGKKEIKSIAKEITNLRTYKENTKGKKITKRIVAAAVAVSVAFGAFGCSKIKKETPPTAEDGNYQEMSFEELLSLLKEGKQRESFALMDEVQDYFNNVASPSIAVAKDNGAQLFLRADEIVSLFTYANADTYTKETFNEIFGSTFDESKITEDYTNAARVLNNYYLRAKNSSGLDKLFSDENNQQLFKSFEELVLDYNTNPTKTNKQRIQNKLDEIFLSGKIDSLKNTCPEATSFIGTHMIAALELNGVLSKKFADQIIEMNETVTCDTLKGHIKEIDEYTDKVSSIYISKATDENGVVQVEELNQNATYIEYIKEAMDEKNIKVSSRDIAPIIKGLKNPKVTNSSAYKSLQIKGTTYKRKTKTSSRSKVIKIFGKDKVKEAEKKADKNDKIIEIDDKKYSIDEANAMEEVSKSGYSKGYSFRNQMYQDLYYNRLNANYSSYQNQIESIINSYNGKYKSTYAKNVRDGFRDAYNNAVKSYNDEKKLRDDAAKEEKTETTIEHYRPIQNNNNNNSNNKNNNNNSNNNNNNNSNNNNNNSNNNNNQEIPKDNTHISNTEKVTPSEDNDYTYEITVERVRTK